MLQLVLLKPSIGENKNYIKKKNTNKKENHVIFLFGVHEETRELAKEAQKKKKKV